jgi:hypothetical protein
MKNKSVAGRYMKTGTAMLIIIVLLALAPSAQAAIVFYDDFEEGNHDDWALSTTGGTGSTSVVEHNLSQMAYIDHTGIYRHTLSHDFSYAPGDMLSFDMHAVTVAADHNTQSSAGVTLSFLNGFNTSLGHISLINPTDPAMLGAYEYEIDGAQHHYSNLMSTYVAQTNIADESAIESLSLQFWAQGQTSIFNDRSKAQLWFDNVQVESVPIPSAILLLGGGLMGLLGVRYRRR